MQDLSQPSQTQPKQQPSRRGKKIIDSSKREKRERESIVRIKNEDVMKAELVSFQAQKLIFNVMVASVLLRQRVSGMYAYVLLLFAILNFVSTHQNEFVEHFTLAHVFNVYQKRTNER